MRKLDIYVHDSMNVRIIIAALPLAGILVCLAVNAVEADVRVSQGPALAIAHKRNPFLLNCSATSISDNRETTTKWYKNGVLIEPDKRIHIIENGSLYFDRIKRRKNKQRNDEGLYECRISDHQGSFISRRIDLKIARIARTVSIEPLDVEAVVGGVARFVCSIEAVPQVPESMYVWQKDQSPLPDDNRFTRFSSGNLQILQIHNIQENDAGEYHCSVYYQPTSNFNPRYSKAAILNVNQRSENRPPSIVAFSYNTTNVKEDETTTLECLADGKPKPSVVWMKQGGSSLKEVIEKTFKPIKLDAFKKIVGDGNLEMKIRKEDAGSYKCVVSSPPYGEVEASAMVQVVEAPKLIKGPERSQEYKLTKTVRLDCEISSIPMPSITWYFNGEKIAPVQTKEVVKEEQHMVIYSKQLIIKDSTINDTGYYQCVAENSVGYIIATAKISVKLPDNGPDPPTNAQGVAISSSEISVHWKAGERAKWHTVNYQKVGAPEEFVHNSLAVVTNITIENLEPFTDYRIYIHAFNSAGASQKSNIIVVRTKESVPSMGPSVSLSALPKGIQVQWTWNKMENKKNGNITEYKIYYMTGDAMTEIRVPGNMSSYTITDLKADTLYKVCVFGRTSVGYPTVPAEHWVWITVRTLSAPTYHPNVSVTCINSTTVKVDWDIDNSTHPKVTGFRVILHEYTGKGLNHNITTDSTTKSHVFTNFGKYWEWGEEKKMFYALSFMVMSGNTTIGMTEESFETRENCMIDPRPPPPLEIDAMALPGNKIHLSWQRPKTQQDIKYYTIKYNEVENPHKVIYERSDTQSYYLEGLSSATWYSVSVRSHLQNNAGPFGNTIHVQTKEQVPSPPEHITVETEGGILRVEWKPPSIHHGTVTYYIIMYNENKEDPDTMWHFKRVNGSQTSEVLTDLSPHQVYYFKVKACNKIGESQPSKIIEVKICSFGCPGGGSDQATTAGILPIKDQRLGIIIGCTVGLASILICILVVYFRQRHYSRMYNQQQQQQQQQQNRTQYTNGPCTMIQRNGHVGQYHGNHDQHEPMLTENVNSDAKGPGSGVVFSSNGKIIYLCSKNSQNGRMRALVAEPDNPTDTQQEHQPLLTFQNRENTGVSEEIEPRETSGEGSAKHSGSNVSLSCDPSICSRLDSHSQDNSPDSVRAKNERGYKFENRKDSLEEEEGEEKELNEPQHLNGDNQAAQATSVSAVVPQDNGASGYFVNDSGISGHCFHDSDGCHGDKNGEFSQNIHSDQEYLNNSSENVDVLSKMLEATTDHDESLAKTFSPLTSNVTSAASSSLPQSKRSRSPVGMVKMTPTIDASDQIV